MSLIQTLSYFLLALTILVFVHESGHYLVARWCGVRILRFSIGFGPALVRWRVGADQTEWVLAAVPLGGYVKMLGESDDGEWVSERERADRAFGNRPLWQRALIVAAGPAANFLLAIALYAALAFTGAEEPVPRLAQPAAGTPAAHAGIEAGDRVLRVDGRAVQSWNDFRLAIIDVLIDRRPLDIDVEHDGASRSVRLDIAPPPSGQFDRQYFRSFGLSLAVGEIRIGSVLAGGAAERDGLRAGDRLLRVDSHPVGAPDELVDLIRAHPGQPLRFELQRGADTLLVQVTPEAVPSDRPAESARVVGRIGAALTEKPETIAVRHGPLDAALLGVSSTWEMSAFSLRMLGKMLVGELSWKNLSGPVAIADHAGQSARVGWRAYLGFLALISVSLGVLNLLPVPVLDGGHLVYYAVEAVVGGPLPKGLLEITQKAGLGIILLMTLLALFNDISRLIGS